MEIEELTNDAPQIQEKILEEILMRNAGTEYLKRFLNGQTDKQLFKNNVPIVTYEDIKPYIDRIVNGEPSDILLADPVIEFHLSSGTSGGQPKLIPSTAETSKNWALLVTLLGSVVKKQLGDSDKPGKKLQFMFTKPESETPSGITVRAVSTSLYKDSGFRKIAMFHTSPIETIFCPDNKQSMYCQLLAGLIQRDEVVTIGANFASAVVRAVKFLEGYWNELCSNIKTGQISDWVTDSGCKSALSSIVKPDPELADSIENICGSKSWEGIIRKLWPKVQYIDAISTGSVMSQYIAALDFYCGGLPLVSMFYASSEAICGINLEPLTRPSDVSYTFLPSMAYFEFLPLKKDSETMTQEVQSNGTSQQESIELKSNNEDIEPVNLVNVKLGQCYELIVTTFTGLYRYRVGDILMVTGFHNSTPQFKFVERRNVILSIDADKTSESELLKAVTEAKTLLDPQGFILTWYTSYADTSSTPGHYVIFWELNLKERNDIIELDPEIMVECCYKMEESLNYTYKIYRKENAIAALEIRVVSQGAFDALMDYYVSQGTSMSQYKTPSCIKSKEALKILDSRVIGKFFSQNTPE